MAARSQWQWERFAGERAARSNAIARFVVHFVPGIRRKAFDLAVLRKRMKTSAYFCTLCTRCRVLLRPAASLEGRNSTAAHVNRSGPLSATLLAYARASSSFTQCPVLTHGHVVLLLPGVTRQSRGIDAPPEPAYGPMRTTIAVLVQIWARGQY
eukprot:3649032-Rhodomonas_salina.1